MDFSIVTACGECCLGCIKIETGACPGCIEANGIVPEWSESGRCRVHECAEKHHAEFCGVCDNFPCDKVSELIHWNPNIIEHLTAMRNEYFKSKS